MNDDDINEKWKSLAARDPLVTIIVYFGSLTSMFNILFSYMKSFQIKLLASSKKIIYSNKKLLIDYPM